jgi:hypothetical protein
MSDQSVPPFNNSKRKSESFLPNIFKSPSNKKFLAGTLDPLIQDGTVKRLNGYIGRQTSKTIVESDIYIDSPLKNRQDYQLEPSLLAEDNLGNVKYFKDYIDYVNTISVLGGITNNHQRLNQQEFYSWEPHIDWDKIVNYLQYYWLPYGPETILISGTKVLDTVSTFTVSIVDEGDNFAYLFTPNGLTRNPDLRLYRGETYRFELDTPDQPFTIKTERLAGEDFKYSNGVTNNGIAKGILEFKVPLDSPDVLFYVSENNVDSSGVIKVFDIEENSQINVDEEVIGKKSYTLSNGLSLTNGMKIKFRGLVTPSSYRDNTYYVEGVGDAITLIDEKNLEVVSSYTNYLDVNYDSVGFDDLPFNNINYAAVNKDYITINRSSRDRNHWSRHNRWIHQEVIIKTAQILGKQPIFDQLQRATRPIIEFKPNIKLYNFGTKSKINIDLIDDFTRDAFSVIEGSFGYNIDGVKLLNGHRVIFKADEDITVRNKIYKVEFLNIFDEDTGEEKRQIHLAEEPDSIPNLDEVVLVLGGTKYLGKMFWFNGTTWTQAQDKTGVNQSPLFDLFDNDGFSLSDPVKYSGSTFKGTKLFSYKNGNGTKDTELGFALSYRSINNIGDILFDFDLLNDNFTYKQDIDVLEESTNNKFLKKFNSVGVESFVNGWTRSLVENYQPIIRIFKKEFRQIGVVNQVITNNFPIDVYDDRTNLQDLDVKIYVNGKRIYRNQYKIVDGLINKEVLLDNDINETDVVVLKCYSKQEKNSNGYYEFPINFQNNSLNENLTNFTLGEILDHVDTIVDHISGFEGVYPGISNLRDQSNLSSYGTKFVKHSGSLNLSLYHLTDKTANLIRALDKARDDYGKFKRSFVYNFDFLEDDINVKENVDKILFNISKGKSKTSSYYFSNMLAYSGSIKTSFNVIDGDIKKYPLSSVVISNVLDPRVIYIYVNKNLLLHERDYIFTLDGYVEILSKLNELDVIDIYEYDNTDGCFVPQTPTCLGLYPKYEPKKYLDTTLVEPKNVIQGHDGSIILAFDDFRDDLILELEKRIFNNIKINYDPKIFDIFNFIPGSNRPTDYSLSEFNTILAPNFFTWSTLIDTDFTKQLLFLSTNPFTYNYSEAPSVDNSVLAGFWRGIYKWYYDTDRIHICPWEALGFSIKPKWWEHVYGAAPYTSNNLILWEDLKNGIIREPGRVPIVNTKYIRPILSNIPVDEQGNLLDPINNNIATGLFNIKTDKGYEFGDQGPVETAWRRSSYYPFSLIKSLILMFPNHCLGLLLDRSRIKRNAAGQIIYEPTGLHIRLKDIITPSVYSDDQRTYTSGLINYVIEYLTKDNIINLTEYRNTLSILTNKLSHRIGGYTSKEKFNLILDSKNVSSSGGVFVPQENYKIFLNTSSPIKKLFYSAVIITRLNTTYGVGYEIKGYSQTQPYFYYYPWTKVGYNVNVGGISESYINWENDQRYVAGNIVKIDNGYYRVKISHTSSSFPDYDLLQKLPSLPIIGGRDANIRSEFSDDIKLLNYGTILTTIQDVVDFLLGYGVYLESQGFVFDNFNKQIQNITNWELSVKEFLFWTTQNWSSGASQYTDWSSDTLYRFGNIVYYEGEFYKVFVEHTTSEIFNPEYYLKIDELDNDGASAISLSPASLKLDLDLDYFIVDDIRETNNDYEIFAADGSKYDFEELNYLRYDNTFSIQPKQENKGIYGAGLYLIQKEHVLIIDNLTQFNDVIYNIETGYRQERIKTVGYKTTNWNGSFDAPGFIYDQARIQEWNQYTDYKLGDIVKYKEFYYTAKESLIGQEKFDNNQWIRVNEKITSRLIPNWDYKALQFTDFYDLDSDNFDINQQRIAQHLIGYQKRNYLENIIQNDVSEFKFYQGMITEKGTFNSLNKLFDVLSNADQDSLDFVEEWMIRVGHYGASEAFEEIEFVLDESLFKIEPQNFELVSSVDNSILDFVVRQTKHDLYVQPINYQNDIWPKNNNFKPYLKTPGFVRLDHAKYAIDKKSDILNLDIKTLTNSDYIWCGFESKINQFGDDWGIYRFSYIDIRLQSIASTNTITTITFDVDPSFVVGDIVGFTSKTYDFNLWAVVTESTNKTVKFSGISRTLPGNVNYRLVDVYKIINQRYTNIDYLEVPKFLKSNDSVWNYGELVWFYNNKNEIWQNIPIYEKKFITDSSLLDDSFYGYKTVINKLSTVMLVSTYGIDKKVFVYKKPFNTYTWVKLQILKDSETQNNFGKELAISVNASYLAVAAHTLGNNGIVNIYKRSATGEYDLQSTIINPDVQDEFFGYNIKFAEYNNDTFVFISSTDSISISGKIYIFKLTVNNWNLYDVIGPLDNCNEEPFAYAFDVNEDGSILATSACLNDGGKVFVYNRNNTTNQYDREQVLDLPNNQEERFGFDIALSETGNLMAISSTMEDILYKNQGRVRLYNYNTSNCTYSLEQVIDNRSPESDEEFGEQYGYGIKFANNEKTLVIFSKYGDASVNSVFGLDSSQNFIDTGRIDVYDQYLTKFVFSESLPISSKLEGYGASFDVGNNIIIVGAPNYDSNKGKTYVYTKPNNEFTWKKYLEETDKTDPTVFKKIFLYDKKTSTLVKYLDIVDPIQGKILGVADKELRYKTYYDPAIYSVKSNTATVNVDVDMAWLDKQVGTLWWNLTRAKFIDPCMGDTTYRNTTWSTLFPTASIDVYEWVSSRVNPVQWDELSDTEDGFSLGISGKSLYGSNAYSIKKTYDTISKTFISTYYFWVKGKQTIPSVSFRTLSSIDVANNIAEPRNYGISHINFIDFNAFSLVNCKNLLKDKDIILSVQYWTVPEKEKQHIHNEWRLISENEKTEIPKHIERKWIDSLVGFDENGKMTPDLELNPKQRYGVEFKPRQGMFVNRIEAVKQVIERFNYEMKNVQIDNIDLSDLFLKDEIPNKDYGHYDFIKDTDAELRFININNFKQPILEPILEFGRIVKVNILDAGLGYQYAPTVQVIGSGVGAKVKTTINKSGSITSVTVIESGQGYDETNIELRVRSLSALVISDSNSIGLWTIYSLNGSNWYRTRTQQYNVLNFWNYIDWYQPGYNQFTKIDYVVDGVYQIYSLPVEIGQIVKVNTSTSTSKWMLLEKYNNIDTLDYTLNYRVVGKNNGSIQLSDKFYNFGKNKLGFDSELFDSNTYDSIGTNEIRIILNSFKNKILIDDRRIIYIKLFFVTLRYILSEQLFTNWIVKSSFIKALHNVGTLKQKINYKNDNLIDYEKYIQEVKPFRTKIREFISIYNNIDSSQSLISDFDLPSYTTNKIVSISTQFLNNEILVNDPTINEFPWSSWRSSLGFSVNEIIITEQGEEYTAKPIIRFEGSCTRPAKAMPFIVKGRVVKIELLDGGEGYFAPPKIIIEGNLSRTGKLAKAYASIGNNLVRSNLIGMKFDRYTKESMVDLLPLVMEETFVGDNVSTSFNLKYSPKTDLNTIIVLVNNQELVPTNYTVEKTYSVTKGHHVYYGILKLNDVVEEGLEIRITYQKDFVHLNASERIKHYYEPDTGQLGKDLSQLMTGIDYGGVSVTGLGFEKSDTWDGEYGWGERPWDEGIPADEDLYDTFIEGGNLNPNSAYRTANGLRADDIIIDGDGFITPTTSPAPEEMVPGHISDSLAISVFERRLGASSEIITNVFLTNGIEDEYKIGQYPNNKNALIVKIDDNILNPNEDYELDYNNQKIKLVTIPAANKILSITSLGFNGSNILDIGVAIVTQETDTVITDFSFIEDLTSFTLVSGSVQNSSIFATTEADGKKDLVGIKFPFTLPVGTVVNYTIFKKGDDSQSLVSRETIYTTGTTKKYYLNNPIGNRLPFTSNVIVRVEDIILDSVDTFQFYLKNGELTYDMPLDKVNIDLYSLNDYIVYIDNVRVDLSTGYTLDLFNKQINIKSNYYKDNALVVVAITKEADYQINQDVNGTFINLRSTYPNNTEIEIIAMFNHDILDIERSYSRIQTDISSYVNNVFYLKLNQIGSGVFKLDRKMINANYVWVTKNKKLLTPNIDYILLEDRESISVSELPKTTDRFGIMTFSANVVRNPIEFMQFKDMLNRVSYKRLHPNRTTELDRDLLPSDREILVKHSGRLRDPNKDTNSPGVVYVNGERIEYFVKVGEKLSQLRRGTLGTGVPSVHLKGTLVYDIGPAETIPYNDEVIVWTKNNVNFDDSTNTLILPFVPNKDNIEVFVGSKRLRKNSYTLHDRTIHPESPEGDQIHPPEFIADGINHGTADNRIGYLVLAEEPPMGSPITVVLKRLTYWSDPDRSLSESVSKQAHFLRYNVEEIEGTEPTLDSGLYRADSDDLNVDED